MLVPCGPIGPPAPVNSGVRPLKKRIANFSKTKSNPCHLHHKSMRLTNKFSSLALAIILKSQAVLGCPPPILPPGWKPPTWNQTIATEFERAQTVALIDVTNVNVTQTSVEHGPTEFTSKGNFRSIKVYKGAIEILPNPFELQRTSIDCDRRHLLGETGMKIVFINERGEIDFAVYKGNSYQPTINALEKIIR
jgi:hypothetical protein